MPLTFWCYTAADGSDAVLEWYLGCDEDTQGQFFGVVQQLEQVERARHDESMFKALQKRAASRCLGLHEVLIDFEGRHFRVLGFLHNDNFVMLCGFCKNTLPKYGTPCQLAQDRKTEVLADNGRARPWHFPL